MNAVPLSADSEMPTVPVYYRFLKESAERNRPMAPVVVKEAQKLEKPVQSACLRIRMDKLDFGVAEQVIGTGATCEVIAAAFHGTRVVVKRLLHAQNEDNLQALEREVAILTMLRHPNIVQCLGAALTNGQRPCILLELLEGGSLADAIHVAKPALSVRQLAASLVYLHSRVPSVVHRDVKPPNVLLNRTRENAKLGDFGISRLAQTLLSKSPTMNIRTPEYCPPEIFNPAPAKVNSGSDLAKLDVYSFAVTFWETMTARKPFAECAHPMQVMFSVASGARPDVAALPLICSAPLRDVLGRCWSASPDQRPSMRQVLAVLDPVAFEALEIARDAANGDRLCVVGWSEKRATS